MKYAATFLALLLVGCGQQARSDRAKLDGLLLSNQIDAIVFTSLLSTNVLTGAAVQKYARALDETNRMPGSKSKAQLDAWVSLMSGTNRVAELCRYETGDWEFGDGARHLKPA
jgi:hypothetical protein